MFYLLLRFEDLFAAERLDPRLAELLPEDLLELFLEDLAAERLDPRLAALFLTRFAIVNLLNLLVFLS